jgi:PAS domain S-box-containing protein
MSKARVRLGRTSVSEHAVPAEVEGDPRLQLVLEAASLALWDWDLSTGRLRWEGHGLGFAKPPQTFEPAPGAVLAFAHPDDREMLRRGIEHAVRTGAPCHLELRAVDSSGESAWMGFIGRVHGGAQGHPVRFIGVLRNITERKRTEEALRREARILEGVHDAVISADMRGMVTTWNRAAERILGYTAAEAVGRSVEFLWFPEDLPLYEDLVLQPTIKKGTHEVVLHCRRRDGTGIFVALRLTLLRDERDQPVGIIGCSNDITDAMRIEEALRKQQRDLQVILDAVPAYIWYKDDKNVILRANRAAAESMGTTVAALEGRSTYDLYPEEAARYHRDDLEVIRAGRPKLGIIEPLRTLSGEKRWIRTDKIPYANERGEIVGVIVFAVDITERIRAEEALQRARAELERRVAERTAQLASAVDSLRVEISERQRAEEHARQQHAALAHVLRLRTVESMAAQLAHEINQPLAAIANFANGLATRLRLGSIDASVMRDIAEQIGRQALRAGQVIQRLRDFVRKDGATRERSDLNHVIEDAVLLVEADARSRGVTLRLQLEREAHEVEIDPIQIEQVVLNLLHNGLEAIDPRDSGSRELVVETALADDGHIEVRVRDTGKGLPVRHARKAFDPFFTTKRDGLGMGLSISRSIVEAHRGKLWAVRNKDRGTTFIFRLPLAARP